MAISKRTRFEVLRRDNHTCRYCGASAPDMTLHVDHVVPKSLGGSDDPSNLVAACRDCNTGKSSASADAALVADVAADAMQWRKALQVAAAMAERDREEQQVNLDTFHARWTGYTYTDTGQTVPLPPDWRVKVGEVFRSGLVAADVSDAVDVAMGARNVENTFAYFLGVCRQKVSQRHEIARELIRRGLA